MVILTQQRLKSLVERTESCKNDFSNKNIDVNDNVRDNVTLDFDGGR